MADRRCVRPHLIVPYSFTNNDGKYAGWVGTSDECSRSSRCLRHALQGGRQDGEDDVGRAAHTADRAPRTRRRPRLIGRPAQNFIAMSCRCALSFKAYARRPEPPRTLEPLNALPRDAFELARCLRLTALAQRRLGDCNGWRATQLLGGCDVRTAQRDRYGCTGPEQ